MDVFYSPLQNNERCVIKADFYEDTRDDKHGLYGLYLAECSYEIAPCYNGMFLIMAPVTL
jgi:hypothetical protein